MIFLRSFWLNTSTIIQHCFNNNRIQAELIYSLAGSDIENGILIFNITQPEDFDHFDVMSTFCDHSLDKDSQYVFKRYSLKNGHIRDINGIDWANSWAQPFIASASDDYTICLWQ
jgi:hypothetical protein